MDAPVPPPDPVDDLLRPGPLPTGADRLRQALFLHTTQLLRRRRYVKRLVAVAGMAACYLAGILTVRWWMPPASGPDAGLVAVKPAGRGREPGPRPRPRSPRPVAAPARNKPRPSPVSPAASARALEWQALDSKDRRFELFRRAGDRYLEESNDVQSAMRCYRGALDAASDKDRVLSVSDNWLFMVVKQERQKEKRDARNGGL